MKNFGLGLRAVPALAMVAWIVSPALGGEALPATRPAPSAKAAPATRPAVPPVPKEVVREIEQALEIKPTPEMTRDERMAVLKERTREVLKLGADAEAKHPKAPNLHLVRLPMIRAASFLTRAEPKGGYDKQLAAIAGRLLASDAPVNEKVLADFLVTRTKVVAADGKEQPKLIGALARRYEKTKGAGRALYFATLLATQASQPALAGKLGDTLLAKHASLPGARDLLRKLGKDPDVGKPFKASLTRLDGTKLTLPDDLLGKVVVIDFWATWCGPCIKEIPRMKRAYAQYKAKGVEFVGISFDRPNQLEQVTRFVKERGLDWVHTYSGKYWGDPTGRAYGISGIPSLWVVGKDGNVVSTTARAALEQSIDRALAAPAPKKKVQKKPEKKAENKS